MGRQHEDAFIKCIAQNVIAAEAGQRESFDVTDAFIQAQNAVRRQADLFAGLIRDPDRCGKFEVCFPFALRGPDRQQGSAVRTDEKMLLNQFVIAGSARRSGSGELTGALFQCVIGAERLEIFIDDPECFGIVSAEEVVLVNTFDPV